MVLVGGLIVGLVMWKRPQSDEAGAGPAASASARATVATSAPTATSTVDAKLPEFAPPALRKDDEILTANPQGGAAPKVGAAATAAPGPGGAPASTTCNACGSGVSNGALNAAIRSRAGTAQGCYQRALRDGGSEGTVTVAVSVGSDGSVCGASVVSDTVNNPSIASCVVGKFRGTNYPKPNEGCVTVQVPITFKVK
jgi:TonB family protein